MSLFKSEVAPKGLDFSSNDMIVVSDKYMTILTVVAYPRSVGVGFLSNITNMPGVKVVVKHIPIEFSTMSKMINKEIADLKDRYQHENDRTMQESIRQDYESLESFVKMLPYEIVFSTFYISLLVLIIDFIFSLNNVLNFKAKLEYIQSLTDQIKQKQNCKVCASRSNPTRYK